MFGAPCQYVAFLSRMTWSPLRHSVVLNGPLNTVGPVFSGAVSISSFDASVTYLPKTWVGSGWIVLRSRIAGHETLVIVMVIFFGFPLSTLTPGRAVAVPAAQPLKH